MKVFEANISHKVAGLFINLAGRISDFEIVNNEVFMSFGIKQFFDNQIEYELFRKTILQTESNVSEPDRTEYGDFQTNQKLTKSVIVFLRSKYINPKLIVEPTCGNGNFIISALSSFNGIKKIVGVEIYKPYIWETKFKIVDFFIANPTNEKPEIEIHHFNVFEFDFTYVLKDFLDKEILVIGNPPWVTNAKLSSLESDNLPQKTNFKKYSGIDAITGRGNFDIGEYITLMMLNAFHQSKGHLAFLVKNSVIKNIVFDQKQSNYKISNLQKLSIDSKKEFNVSVEASLLFCKLNGIPEYTCSEYDFYNISKPVLEFGWINDRFVSNIKFYQHTREIDGLCPFEWRQGIKHDLSTIMELESAGDQFVNGELQEITLEDDLVYGFLKSSDLKQIIINRPRKFTIVTQKKVGEDTSYIEKKYPMTFKYLQSNISRFRQRKSSIYSNKPDFSIFGIGDYSFSPYKICISGLYKTFSFSLVLPFQNKPVMLDDTCYLLGFENKNFAVYTLILLNSDKTKEFLQSITFSDAKRTFTKDILMRIDLFKLAFQFSKVALQLETNRLNEKYNLSVNTDMWETYLELLEPKKVARQLDIFV
jgi:hypothetical protein